MTVDTARVYEVMQSLGIDEHLCDAVADVVMDEHAECIDTSLLPAAMRTAGVPAVHILRTVCGLMQVGLECAAPISVYMFGVCAWT